MPVTPTYPGVYIEEIPSGVHTIVGVSTSVAAFIGFFKEGPMNIARQINGMTDFNRIYGGLDKRSVASYAISQFFLNGGTEAWVVRVASKDKSDPNNVIEPTKASATIKKGTTPAADVIMTAEAKSEGIWGNNLRIEVDHVTSDPTKKFNLTVTRYDGPGAEAKPIASEEYLELTATVGDSRYYVNVVNDASSMINLKKENDGLPASNGTLSKVISLTSAQIGNLNKKQMKVKIGSGTGQTVTLEDWVAADAPSDLRQLRPYLEQAIRKADPNDPAFTGAEVLLVDTNRFLIRSGRGSASYKPNDIVDVSKEDADSLADDLGFTGNGICENVQQYVLGCDAGDLAGAQSASTPGDDGVVPDATALKGEPDHKTGMYALEDVDLFNILCIPRTADLTGTEPQVVIDAALAYCEKKRAFMIVDIPESINTVEEIKDWLDANSSFRNKNAALYFPRFKIPDAMNEYRLRPVAASGTIAGLYSRIDTTRGVWKAAAGTQASLRGVTELDLKMTDAQNGTLNKLAINCFRTFPVYGRVCWGARTLVGSDQQASEWKYIPIRRLTLFIEESLFRGTKWVVFEPNGERLWSQIRMNVGAFMMSLFRQGAFAGSTPDKAFYVKCDAETTTPNDRNKGIVNIEVGFAAMKPAEFVIIKIQQMAEKE